MANPLTPAEIKLARDFRRHGASWERVAKAIGRKTDFVRKSIDIGFRDRRVGYSADYVKRQRTRSSGDVGLGAPIAKPHAGKWPDERAHAPADVLADRDRREQLQPHDLTAALCGDPLPGRSALDMRRPRLVGGK